MSTKTSTYLGCDRSDAMKEERETPPVSHALIRLSRTLQPVRNVPRCMFCASCAY